MTQFVCTVCGHNASNQPSRQCPQCGKDSTFFISHEAAEQRYPLVSKVVGPYVTLLKLGPGTACYRVETEQGAMLIDCPSVFSNQFPPAQAILHTHRDFIGASDIYRKRWGAKVYLHREDAKHPLAANCHTDQPFDRDFQLNGLEAFCLGGHTPGFTAYCYRETLFVGDYTFGYDAAMVLNRFGDRTGIINGARRLLSLISERELTTVCGYNYVTDFASWHQNLTRIITTAN